MSISPTISTTLQVAALLLLSLVVGSMFGIWRGYDLAQYSPATFVEVHQGAVRGLNILLPALGFATLALVVVLAVLARRRRRTALLYVGAALLIVVSAVTTRFVNQPINAQVMDWTATTLPAGWEAIRDSWSSAHLLRLASGVAAELVLILAIFSHRKPDPAA